MYGFGQLRRPFTYVNETAARFSGLDGPQRFGFCVAALPKLITRRAVACARRDHHLAVGMFSHFAPDTVALLTSIQNATLEAWAAAEPAASPMLKALVEVAVA